MATKYSILSALIRPQALEKITIGLLLIDDAGQCFFNYSKDKLAAARHLMGNSAGQLLRDSIRNIANTVAQERETNFAQSILENYERQSLFSDQYISYLSRYNNNIIQFSIPKSINLEVTDQNYQKLYQLYIDGSLPVGEDLGTEDRIEKFLAVNEVQIAKHYNREIQLSSADVKSLIMPVKVDAIGKNERPVIVQFLDLNRRIADIKYELGQVLFLVEAFEEQKEQPKTFLIGEAPARDRFEQHSAWTQLQKHRKFEALPANEAERILDYAKEHGVQPLI